MKKKFAFLYLVFLAFCTTANAAPTARDEVSECVRAAIEGREPVHIKPLLQYIAEGLNRFAEEKKLSTPREKLAFFFTMPATIEVLNDAALREAPTSAPAAARSAILRAVKALNMDLPYQAVDKATRLVTEAGISTACHNAAAQVKHASCAPGVTKENLHMISFRIAEWASMHYLAEELETIIEASFQAALEHLPEELDSTSPFANAEAWEAFRLARFGALAPVALTYANPWLDALEKRFYDVDEFESSGNRPSPETDAHQATSVYGYVKQFCQNMACAVL